MFLPRILRKRRQVVAKTVSGVTPEEFRSQVDFAVDLFQLDPDLPEVIDLKQNAEEIVNDDFPSPMMYLRKLNPDDGIYEDSDGVMHIVEDVLGMRLLRIWSLVRHHHGRIDERLMKIVADGHSTRLYVEGSRDTTLYAVIDGLPIHPHRLADPGNRYEYVCALIKEFTGVDIDWKEQVGRTKVITVAKNDKGFWSLDLERVPEPAA